MREIEIRWPTLLGVVAAVALVALLGTNWYHVDYDDKVLWGRR